MTWWKRNRRYFAIVLPASFAWEEYMWRSGRWNTVVDMVGLICICVFSGLIAALWDEVTSPDPVEEVINARPKKLRYLAAMDMLHNNARWWGRPVAARGAGWALYWDFASQKMEVYRCAPLKERGLRRWWGEIEGLFICFFGEWELVDPHVITAEGPAPYPSHDDVPVASTEGEALR